MGACRGDLVAVNEEPLHLCAQVIGIGTGLNVSGETVHSFHARRIRLTNRSSNAAGKSSSHLTFASAVWQSYTFLDLTVPG